MVRVGDWTRWRLRSIVNLNHRMCQSFAEYDYVGGTIAATQMVTEIALFGLAFATKDAGACRSCGFHLCDCTKRQSLTPRAVEGSCKGAE